MPGRAYVLFGKNMVQIMKKARSHSGYMGTFLLYEKEDSHTPGQRAYDFLESQVLLDDTDVYFKHWE